MGTLGKRARRRQRAQESLERGASHPEQGKDSNVDSEVDMEGDHEVLFHPKRRDDVVIPPTTQRVLEVPDYAVGSVTNMVRTLNDAIAAVSQDTAQIQQAYQQLRRDNLAYCHGKGVWRVTGSHTTIWSTNSKNQHRCSGRGRKFTCGGYRHHLGGQ